MFSRMIPGTRFKLPSVSASTSSTWRLPPERAWAQPCNPEFSTARAWRVFHRRVAFRCAEQVQDLSQRRQFPQSCFAGDVGRCLCGSACRQNESLRQPGRLSGEPRQANRRCRDAQDSPATRDDGIALPARSRVQYLYIGICPASASPLISLPLSNLPDTHRMPIPRKHWRRASTSAWRAPVSPPQRQQASRPSQNPCARQSPVFLDRQRQLNSNTLGPF